MKCCEDYLCLRRFEKAIESNANLTADSVTFERMPSLLRFDLVGIVSRFIDASERRAANRTSR